MSRSRRFLKSIIFVLLIVCLIPCGAYAKTLKTTVRVNMRKSATTKSKVIRVLNKGTKVKYVSKKGSWSYVTYGGKKGYILSKYVKTVTTTSTGTTVYVTGNKVNIRKTASMKGKILKKVSTGTTLKRLSKLGNWAKVKTKSGLVGYIYAKYITENKVTATSLTTRAAKLKDIRSEVYDYCCSRLGDKYSQAKRDEKGYADCSSLMRDAFEKVTGVYIGGNTTAQMSKMKKYLYKVSCLKDVRPGDLVYSVGAKYNHVALYLGDGKILHCSSTVGKVTFSTKSMTETGYWTYGCKAAEYALDNK